MWYCGAVCAAGGAWWRGEDDARGGGVAAEVIERAEPGGAGGDGDLGLGEELAGELDSGADGGGVGAEQRGQRDGGQAMAQLQQRGQDVVGEVQLAGGQHVGGPAGPPPRPAAQGVQVLLAAGGERDGQPGDQGVQVAERQAGERGRRQGGLVAPGGRGGPRRRVGGRAGGRAQGVVPLAVEV